MKTCDEIQYFELMKSQYFQDFDEFTSTVRDADTFMMLLNLNCPSWSITHADLPQIHIQIGREGGGNITEGQSRSDGYIIFLPLNHAKAYTLNGIALEQNSFAILEPGSEFCLRCMTEHDWASVFIPTHKLAPGTNLVRPLSGSEKMSAWVTRPNLHLVNQFQSLVDTVITAASNYSEFESSPAGRCVEEELLKVVSSVVWQRQGGRPEPGGRPRLPRAEIIGRSKELLEEHEGKVVLLEELAAASEVSERTLRTAFKEYFGVGPARYLQLRKLHQVYRALLAAESGAVILNDVLLRYGVWEGGRFASQYRRLFGELPSQTLRSKTR